jgi:hypothetical protein
MVTGESSTREIKDLQRLLLSVGLMEFTASTESGKWGVETQEAVLRGYEMLGWEHPADGRWISTPALAALASAMHHHSVAGADTPTGEGIGGGGSHAGGGGSHAGGGGSHAGGGGSHAGGGGSHAGGGGSHAGGGGSHAGGGGSHAGGGGSHAGGGGSHAGAGGDIE